jgi:hypothetical protein
VKTFGARFRLLDVEQGSVEWQMARLGIPTASNFDKIITPKTMKPSASAEKYAWALIAEQILEGARPKAGRRLMQRGKVVEEKRPRRSTN